MNDTIDDRTRDESIYCMTGYHARDELINNMIINRS